MLSLLPNSLSFITISTITISTAIAFYTSPLPILISLITNTSIIHPTIIPFCHILPSHLAIIIHHYHIVLIFLCIHLTFIPSTLHCHYFNPFGFMLSSQPMTLIVTFLLLLIVVYMSITENSGAVQSVIDAASVPPLTFDLGDEQPQFKAHERKSMAEVKYLIIAHNSIISCHPILSLPSSIIPFFLILLSFVSITSYYYCSFLLHSAIYLAIIPFHLSYRHSLSSHLAIISFLPILL